MCEGRRDETQRASHNDATAASHRDQRERPRRFWNRST
jgi:hypothetical protein